MVRQPKMSASASRRDNTDRSLARSAWESIPRKNRPVGYGMIGRANQRCFSSKWVPCFCVLVAPSRTPLMRRCTRTREVLLVTAAISPMTAWTCFSGIPNRPINAPSETCCFFDGENGR